jgi:uncharacterized protein YdhG (YjbR/CyaY superfamily)
VSTTIDGYIAAFPQETQTVLQQVRGAISEMAPGATETISYGIPTFDLQGTHLVHFAAFKKHVGFYPTSSGIEAFREDLGSYTSAKGSVQFPLDRPMPLDLIRRITAFRLEEVTGSAAPAGPG